MVRVDSLAAFRTSRKRLGRKFRSPVPCHEFMVAARTPLPPRDLLNLQRQRLPFRVLHHAFKAKAQTVHVHPGQLPHAQSDLGDLSAPVLLLPLIQLIENGRDDG